MGLRGKMPGPNSVRALHNASVKVGAPRPSPGAPNVPEHFDAVRLLIWNRLCDALADMNLLFKVDGVAMERYVDDLFEYRKCRAFIEKNSRYYPQKTNNSAIPNMGKVPGSSPPLYIVGFVAYPEGKILDACCKRMNSFEVLFGLSPGARGRMTADLPTIKKFNAMNGEEEEEEDNSTVRTRVRV